MKQNIASINGCYQHVIPASSVRHARKNNTRKWFIRKRNWIFPHFPKQRVFKAIFLSLLTITVRYPPSWTKQIKHLTSLQSYSLAVSIHVSCSIIHIGVNIGAQNLHILFCSIYVGWNRPYYVMLYWVIGPCLLFIPPFDSFLNYLKKVSMDPVHNRRSMDPVQNGGSTNPSSMFRPHPEGSFVRKV